jgi:hypothetical protein
MQISLEKSLENDEKDFLFHDKWTITILHIESILKYFYWLKNYGKKCSNPFEPSEKLVRSSFQILLPI